MPFFIFALLFANLLIFMFLYNEIKFARFKRDELRLINLFVTKDRSLIKNPSEGNIIRMDYNAFFDFIRTRYLKEFPEYAHKIKNLQKCVRKNNGFELEKTGGEITTYLDWDVKTDKGTNPMTKRKGESEWRETHKKSLINELK